MVTATRQRSFFQHNRMNKLLYFLIIVVFAGFVVQRAFNPFEEDQKIFFASANISNASAKHFPGNVLETFELKPFYNRAVYYGIYKLAQPLHLWENKYSFIVAVQLIFLLFLVLGAYLFSRSHNASVKNQWKLFFITSIFLVTAGSDSFMQAEHLAIGLLVYAVFFLSRQKVVFDIIAGILLGFVAGLKGITLLYAGAVLVFSFFYFRKSNYWIVSLALVIVFGTSILISWKELETAKLLQGNGLNLRRFFDYFRITYRFVCIDQAYMLSLVCCLVLIVLVWIKNKKDKPLFWKFIFPAALMFALVVPTVVLQVGFSYHYFGLLLFLLLLARSVLQFEGTAHFATLKKFIDLRIALPALLMYLFFSTPVISHSKNVMQYNLSNFRSEIAVNDSISKIIPAGERVLFLTDGVLNFYSSNPSACYEFFPITINRLMPKYPSIPVKLKPRYEATLSCIKNFTGNYIVLGENWLPKEKYPGVYPDSNYVAVASLRSVQRTYLVYKRRTKEQ